MKFSEGDKVRVKNDLIIGLPYNDVTVTLEMARSGGKIFTISRTVVSYSVGPYGYKLKEDVKQYTWTDDMLERVSQPTKNIIHNISSPIAETNVDGFRFTCDGISICELSKDTKINSNEINLNKEKNIMKILRIYKERKKEGLKEYFESETNKIKDEDTIRNILIDTENQINAILENEGKFSRATFSDFTYFTKETDDKLNKLREEYYNQSEQLEKTIEEIEALFEMTDNYEERIKILKRYGIVGKDGKLNV